MSKDDSFLARAMVPIDNRKEPTRFQDRRDCARKPWLVRDAVERIRYQDEVNRPSYEVGNGVNRASASMPGSRSIAMMCRTIRASGAVKRPSPQQRSTTSISDRTLSAARTCCGWGHNACHQSESGMAVAGKNPGRVVSLAIPCM